MYSPKIEEDLIRKIYLLKTKTGKPMTVIINNMLRKSIKSEERKLGES